MAKAPVTPQPKKRPPAKAAVSTVDDDRIQHAEETGKPSPPPQAPGPRTDVNDKGQRKPPEAEAEENQVKVWASRITLAEAVNDTLFNKKIPRLRDYVTGIAHNDGAGGLVRTNLIFSTIATNLPHIYAKDPEIQVTLTPAVPKNQYGPWKNFARGLQTVLDAKFTKGAKLKLRAKSAVRATMTTSVGWCKVVYQSDVRTDPLTGARANDAQDNIQRILSLVQQIEQGKVDGTPEKIDAQKLELQNQLEALNKQIELQTAHGLIMDRILTEDLMILDPTIKDFDYYVEADAIDHRIWMTAQKYQDTFGYAIPEGATTYEKPEIARGEDVAGGSGSAVSSEVKKPNTGSDKPPAYYAVHEIWQKSANTVYTFAKGAKVWAREPYQPEHVGKRWYPFFGLAFNPVDGRFQPMSDVELLTELQDEYNTTRTNFAEARKSAIPVLIVRTGGDLTPEDIKKIENRKINQIIAVEGTPDKPIANELAFLPTAAIDPKVYDTSMIRQDFDMVSGTADAARGNIQKVKTATEADILQQGLMSRGDERRDVMEDWVADMAQYSAEILLDCMTKDQAAQIIGPDAAQDWPELSKANVFNMVQLQIKAGSAGRPNQDKEREQWIQLLPEIQKTIEQVWQLQASGDPLLARTSIELLKETLERFDEYIDLDRFIPRELQDGEDNPMNQMLQQFQQISQQVQQLTEQNQELQAELQKEQQATDAAQRGEQVKLAAQHSADELARQKQADATELDRQKQNAAELENRRKQTNEAANQTREYNFKKQLAELEVASRERIEIAKARIQAELQDKAAQRDAQLQKDQLAHEAAATDKTLKSQESQAALKLKSGEKVAGEKNKSGESIAKDKNKTTERTAAAGNDTTVKTAQMGHAADAKAADAADEPAQSAEAVLSKLADAVNNLAEASMADNVPERDGKGAIVRVRKVPRAKPKAKAKAKA